MKLVLTNDDGIGAPGIDAMEKILMDLGTLTVAAPDQSNSGVGHQVTTQSAIQVDQVGKDRYRIAGTPADCSRIALTQIAPNADWLIAGINRGGNLGADVYISGTVAAAREAALLGYRAIAVSHYVAKDKTVDWDLAARRVRPLIGKLLADGLPSGYFYNVNLPHPDTDDPEIPAVFCLLDTRPFGVQYEKSNNHFTYTGNYHTRPRQPGRDVDVCMSGKISVTRIPLEITKQDDRKSTT